MYGRILQYPLYISISAGYTVILYHSQVLQFIRTYIQVKCVHTYARMYLYELTWVWMVYVVVVVLISTASGPRSAAMNSQAVACILSAGQGMSILVYCRYLCI